MDALSYVFVCRHTSTSTQDVMKVASFFYGVIMSFIFEDDLDPKVKKTLFFIGSVFFFIVILILLYFLINSNQDNKTAELPSVSELISSNDKVDLLRKIKLNGSSYPLIVIQATETNSSSNNYEDRITKIYLAEYDSVSSKWITSITDTVGSNPKIIVGKITGLADSIIISKEWEGSGAFLTFSIYAKRQNKYEKIALPVVDIYDLPQGDVYCKDGIVVLEHAGLRDYYKWNGNEFARTVITNESKNENSDGKTIIEYFVDAKGAVSVPYDILTLKMGDRLYFKQGNRNESKIQFSCESDDEPKPTDKNYKTFISDSALRTKYKWLQYLDDGGFQAIRKTTGIIYVRNVYGSDNEDKPLLKINVVD